jgi:hypothetical protein
MTEHKWTCAKCIFWLLADEGSGDDPATQAGYCRRKPPQPSYTVPLARALKGGEGQLDDPNTTARKKCEEVLWPSTYGDDWCGEWRPG